jgi:hypothetical protein
MVNKLLGVLVGVVCALPSTGLARPRSSSSAHHRDTSRKHRAKHAEPASTAPGVADASPSAAPAPAQPIATAVPVAPAAPTIAPAPSAPTPLPEAKGHAVVPNQASSSATQVADNENPRRR